jgi:hypothetical protein
MEMHRGRALVVLILGLASLDQSGLAQSAVAQLTSAASRPWLDACAGNRARGALTIRAANQGTPFLSLCDGYTLSEPAQANAMRPLSLASADFDGDGVPDLVSGYEAGKAGAITVYRGNVDALWPYGANLNGPPPAFLPNARSFAVPEAPSLIAVGDFNADGHFDVVTAKLGSDGLYFLRGDGHGGFAAPERIGLGGTVTAMTSGEVNRADGLTDVVVAISSASGPRVLVFESPMGAMKAQPEIFTIPHPATSLALGRFDGNAMNDLAVAAGNQIVVIHARDRMLSLSAAQRASVPQARVTAQAFSYTVQAIVAGDFTSSGLSIAALGSDGSVHILDHALSPTAPGAKSLNDSNFQPTFQVAKPGPDSKPMIVAGRMSPGMQARRSALRQSIRAGGYGPEWTERNTVSLPAGFAQAIPRLVAAHLTGSGHDDIAVVDSGNSLIHILSTKTQATVAAGARLASSARMRLLTSLEASGAPAAVLPMRLNQHGLRGLVVLQAGQSAPTVIPQDIPASNIFTVTNTQDLTTTSVPVPDGPPGSLRAAINAANGASGPAEIVFDIPTTDPGYNPTTGAFVIKPISSGTQAELLAFALPYIGNTITIDGYTQPGASPNSLITSDNAVIKIQIDGSLTTTPGNDGLEPFDDDGSTIRGISFTAWTSYYVNNGGSSGACGVEAFGVGDYIEGNFLGTDPTGLNVVSNHIGVFVDNGGSAESIVGGTTPQARNLISGNQVGGVLVLLTSPGTQVLGNFVGTDITGAALLPNTFDGIGTNGPLINFGAALPGAGNLVAGNGTNIDLNDLTDEGASANSLVQGNLIGTDGTGTKTQAFGTTGVSILNNPVDMTIGGTTPLARNVISGNATGIYVFDNAFNNTVQGNYIGTDITGTVALPNLTYGFESGSVAETTDGVVGTDVPAGLTNIGGSVPGAGNLISGNLIDGINISGTSQYPATYGPLVGNTIQGNFIGTDYTGTQPIPNHGNGVYLLSGATNNLIGGTEPGAGNLIAYNQLNGVLIDPGTGAAGPGTGNQTIANTLLSNVGAGVRINTGNQDRISKNSIFGNGALGINLDGLGANLNTNCNVTTTGPNNQQNAPVLTAGTGAAFISATATDPNGNTSEFSNSVPESLSGNVLDLLGTFNGLANTAYTIEFFSSPSADSSGYGQGKTYIGATTVTTNGTCTAPVSDPVNLTQADVSVTLAGNSFGLQAGADFGQESYTGTITNIGPATAHSVVFQDVLPPGLTISGANCNLGSCQSPITTSFGSCTVNSNTITCNLGTLPPGTTSTVNIPVAVVPLASGSITNTATVSATEVDPNLANNTSSVTETVTYQSPLIDRIDPSSVLVNNPTDLLVTIYGYWLLPNSSVTFNGNPVSNVAFLDNQGCGFEQLQYCPALQVSIPASMLTTVGTPSLTVSNPNPAPNGYTDYPSSATFTIAATCTFTEFSLFPTPPDTLDSGGTNLIADFVEVTATAPSCPWTASSTVPWAVVLDNASATGSQSVDISIAPNTDPVNSRSGSVTVAGQTINFTQDPGSSCGYDLSPTTASFTTAGGTANTAVTSACFGYFVISYAPWITIAQDSSLLTDDATVTYTVSPNTGAARSGYFVVGGQAFQVTQDGAPCSYALSANSTTLPIGGGTGSVSVTPSPSTCAWTATTASPSPVTITSGASGTGNGTVNFSVAPNTGAALTTPITIGDQNGGSSIYSVIQPSAFSCTFTISPAQVNIPANGESSTVTINASYPGCQWNAAGSDPTAILLPGSSSGVGSGSVRYAVGQNTGPARTLTITAGCQTFTINQAGTETTPNPAPAITSLSPTGVTAGSGAFTLTVNGSGFISSSVVNFNGNARATTYISATQITAAILATDVATAGTPGVTVTNPSPGGGTSNSVTFNITAASAPAATLTPTLAFPNTTVNTTSSPLTATLTNTGNATLNISGIAIGGTNPGDFAIATGTNACGTTLAASATCSIYVTFTPTAAQPYSATLTVTDDATPTTQAASLSGTGTTAPTPAATLTPALAFPTTTANTTSSPLTATLTNTGNATLNIASIAIAGANPSDFAIATGTNACGTTLAASATCSIYVTFKPASAQAYSATLTVTDNATPTTQTASLSGTGIAALTPVATITSTLTFPSTTAGTTTSPLAATLTNTGNATLNITGIAIAGTNPSDFAIATGTNVCGTTLAANASCSIYVTFKPAAAQAYAATLTVTDNATPATQTSALTGTGTAAPAPAVTLTPATLTFSATSGTTSAAQSTTLTNTGNASLTMSGITIAGTNPTNFAQTTTCGTTLAAGASCTISVTFTPTSAASFTATLSVADNASGSPQTVALSGTGTPLPSFTISSATGAQTVAPGGSANYTLTVTPQNGAFTSSISFSASGIPSSATASFQPAALTPASSPATTTLTIAIPAATTARNNPAWHVAVSVLAFLGFLFLPGKRSRRWFAMVMLAAASLSAISALSGCGGGFALTGPAQSYTITVTAAGGGEQQTTTVQLKVQQ